MLKIEDSLENELVTTKSYYKLSSDIAKVLKLKQDDRGTDADIYLTQKYNEYITYYDKSHVLNFEIGDKLIDIEKLSIKVKD
jgi:hypothetical protein